MASKQSFAQVYALINQLSSDISDFEKKFENIDVVNSHEICTESSDALDFTQINEDVDIIERIVDNANTESCIQLVEKEEKIPPKQDKLPKNLPENTQIIITVIKKNYKTIAEIARGESCSKKDWEEQIQRHFEGQQMMWDDTQYNKSKKGDIFCVASNNDYVAFHLIEDVKPVSERHHSWRDNIGQRHRQVLYISVELTRVNWAKWLEMKGAKKLLGSKPVKQNRSQIITFLNQLDN
jgi:hypothetical protein